MMRIAAVLALLLSWSVVHAEDKTLLSMLKRSPALMGWKYKSLHAAGRMPAAYIGIPERDRLISGHFYKDGRQLVVRVFRFNDRAGLDGAVREVKAGSASWIPPQEIGASVPKQPNGCMFIRGRYLVDVHVRGHWLRKVKGRSLEAGFDGTHFLSAKAYSAVLKLILEYLAHP
jgi:hypothetical protein